MIETLLFLAAWIVPWCAGSLLVRACLCGATPADGKRCDPGGVLSLSLGAGIGLGVWSCLHYLWFVCVGPPGIGCQFCELGLGLAVCAGLLRVQGRTVAVGSGLKEGVAVGSGLNDAVGGLPAGWGRLVTWVFALSAVLGLAGMVAFYVDEPHGAWDAWAFWNQRARFVFQAGDNWRDSFGPAFAHVDYPLLIPMSIVRFWNGLGTDAGWVPFCIGVVFLFATLGLLSAGVARLRGRTQGLLAGLVLLATVRFVRTGAAQYADVPLAFFILGTLLLIALHAAWPQRQGRLLVLAGLMAGLGAWTKNEGVLFLIVVLVARGAVTWRRSGDWRTASGEVSRIVAGALPVLLVLLLFKTGLTSDNDLVAGQGLHATLRRLADPSRYLLIGQWFCISAWTVAKPLAFVLPLAAWLLGRAKPTPRLESGVSTLTVSLGLMLAGYCGTYLCTPHALEWHLATSFDRLILQLWPSGLLLYCVLVRTPEELLRDAAGSSTQESPAAAAPSNTDLQIRRDAA